MSEHTPKQPLNDPEYTVPEYSVLLPSDEAKNSTAEDNAPGDSTPEHATTGYREATAGYDATASERVIPERPKDMRNVMRCAAAMIVVKVLSSSLWILLPGGSYVDSERAMSVLFSTLVVTFFFFSIIPIFVLWKIWEGREWARVITIIYSALMVANDVINFAKNFTDSRYFSGLMGGSQPSASYVVSAVSDIIMIALYILMIVLLTRAPIRAYTQVVSGARALERQQIVSETRQATGQVPAELRELFAEDEEGERTSSEGKNPRPPHRSAGWGT